MSFANAAFNRLRDLSRNIFQKNARANKERFGYPRDYHDRATGPLLEQLEPRVMLSGVTWLDADLDSPAYRSHTADMSPAIPDISLIPYPRGVCSADLSYFAHTDGNGDGLWQNGEQIDLVTLPLAVTLGEVYATATGIVEDRIMLPFTVQETGDYRIEFLARMEQEVRMGHGDWLGLSEGHFDVNSYARIMDGNTIIASNQLSATSHEDVGDPIEEWKLDFYLECVNNILFGHVPAIAVAQAYFDMKDSGVVEEASFVKGQPVELLAHLEAGKIYHVQVGTDSTVYAGALGIYAGQSTSAATKLSLTSLYSEKIGSSLPSVSISASDGTASEDGDVGRFVVSRTGDTASAMDVQLGLPSGSARRGVDYELPPMQVTIPAGQSSTSFDLVPVDDDLVESTETVSISIAASGNYTIAGGSGSAEVQILDNEGSAAASLDVTAPSAHPLDGSPLAIVATVRDASGNPMSGVNVSFHRSSGTMGGWVDASGRYTTVPNDGPTNANGQRVQYYIPSTIQTMDFSVMAGGMTQAVSVDAAAPTNVNIGITVRRTGVSDGMAVYDIEARFSAPNGNPIEEGTARFTTSDPSHGTFTTGVGAPGSSVTTPIDNHGDSDVALQVSQNHTATITVEYVEGGVTRNETVNLTVDEAPTVTSLYTMQSPQGGEFMGIDGGTNYLSGLIMDGGLAVWDMRDLSLVRYWDVSTFGSSYNDWATNTDSLIALSHDDSTAVAANPSGIARFVVADGSWSANDAPAGEPEEDSDIAPDGSFWAATSSGSDSVYVYNSVGSLIRTFGHGPATIECISFSPDGTRMAYGVKDQSPSPSATQLIIRDTSNWSIVNTVNITTGKTPSTVTWSPDSQRVAVGITYGTIHVYDRNGGVSGIPVTQFTVDQDPGAMVWSPDGNYLAVNMNGLGVSVLDANTGLEAARLAGPTSSDSDIDRVAWGPNSGVLFVTGGQDTIHVFTPFDKEKPSIQLTGDIGGTIDSDHINITVSAWDDGLLWPSRLRYRVDGATWQEIPLTNGVIDQHALSIPIDAGLHYVEFELADLAGNVTSEIIQVERAGLSALGASSMGAELQDGSGQTIDIGTVVSGQPPLSAEITLSNTGSQPLHLQPAQITGSGSISITRQPVLTLQAGESTTVEVQMSTATIGDHTATIQVAHDGPGDGVFDLTVQGAVIAADINESGPEIDVEFGGQGGVDSHVFSPTSVGEFDQVRLVLRNEGVETLTVTEAAGLSAPFSIAPANEGTSADDWSLASGETQELYITFSPETSGVFEAVLTLSSNDSDESSYAIALSGEATEVIGPRIVVDVQGTENTSHYDFGDVAVGASVSHGILIRNVGTAPLTVSEAQGLTSPFSLLLPNGEGSSDDWVIQPGTELTCTVVFSPSDEGRFGDVLWFRSDDPERPLVGIPLFANGATVTTQELIVTTPLDVVDSTDGLLSLREALAATNSDSLGVITFASELDGSTILLSGEGLQINNSLVVDASDLSSLSIDGGGQSQVFSIAGSETIVSLTGLRITGGNDFDGGGILVADGMLTLADCSVTGNVAMNDAGGILNNGTLVLLNSIVEKNEAMFGGGMTNDGDLVLLNSTVAENTAMFGGGIHIWDGTVALTNVELRDNAASYYGGGLHNYSSGAVVVTNSTVAGNTAGEVGGGIHCNNVAVTLNNTVVASNYAAAAGVPDDVTVDSGAATAVNSSFIGTEDGSAGFVQDPTAGPDGVWGTIDDTAGDYRPRPSSALIDTGDDFLAEDTEGAALTTDIAGMLRIQGEAVDIGAYEYAIPGDLSGDRDIDATDIDILRTNIHQGLNTPAYDLTGDGVTNEADVDMLVHDILDTEYADFNLDGKVGILDLAWLGENYGQSGGWATGDANGDGTVGILDLAWLGEMYGFDRDAQPMGDPISLSPEQTEPIVVSSTMRLGEMEATVVDSDPVVTTSTTQLGMTEGTLVSGEPTAELTSDPIATFETDEVALASDEVSLATVEIADVEADLIETEDEFSIVNDPSGTMDADGAELEPALDDIFADSDVLAVL